MRLLLELQPTGGLFVDIGGLNLASLFEGSEKEIREQALCLGNRLIELGEAFRLEKTASLPDELILCGETQLLLNAGKGMAAGRVVIDGDAGPFTGTEMRGGEIEVIGDAGDCLGAAMQGGILRVRGSAGDWCGAALPGKSQGMTGGTILVWGNAGREAGGGMRRGMLVVGGDAGDCTGENLLAGTILCFGSLGASCGIGMKRGSVVANASRQPLPGFRPAGEADPEWLRLCLTWLETQGMQPPPGWKNLAFIRFTGDHLSTGKGEMLLHDILE